MIPMKSYKTDAHFENKLNGGRQTVYRWWRNDKESWSLGSMSVATGTPNWVIYRVINKHSSWYNEYNVEYWINTTLVIRPLRMELFV